MSTPVRLHQGDVVLVPFPFADLSGTKVRPVVVVSADPQGPEVVVAFITSVLTNRSLRGAEVQLLSTDLEFPLTGLKTDSLARLDKLATLSRTMITRRLGTVGPNTLKAIRAGLSRTF